MFKKLLTSLNIRPFFSHLKMQTDITAKKSYTLLSKNVKSVKSTSDTHFAQLNKTAELYPLCQPFLYDGVNA